MQTSFKSFIKERRKGPLGPVDLSAFPQWKDIMNVYPFIHDYCNPMDAKGIHIIMTETVFGKNKCAALYFDGIVEYSGTHYCEFSYKKIGITEESCLRKRLRTAYSCEFKKITKHMAKSRPCAFGGDRGNITWEHCPPYTFSKIMYEFTLRNGGQLSLARRLVAKRNVGWHFPDDISRAFQEYHNRVAVIKPCEQNINRARGQTMIKKSHCLEELVQHKN